jgi:hypothetical protein
MKTQSPFMDNKNKESLSIKGIREFHAGLPLMGNPPNDLLNCSDTLLQYLAAAIRNQPVSPPEIPLSEWQQFLGKLQPHRIYPLIAWHIKSWPERCQPPEEVMLFLSRTLIEGGVRGLRFGSQVQTIISALDEAGIPVLLLKGPALARTVYPDPALRHSSDIDLLVKPEDVLRCEPVFEQLGYICPEHTFHFAANDRHHQVFYPTGNGCPVELHWATDYRLRMFPQDWLDTAFARKIPIRTEDLSCYTLHPVDHLSFLALHDVFMHQSFRLDWIVDIALIKKTFTMPEDWDELRSSCVRNHLRIPLQLALTAGILWCDEDLPERYRDFSLWPQPSDREQTLWGHAKSHHTSLYSAIYLKLQGQPSMGGKIRVSWRYINPPREFLQQFRRSDSRVDIPFAYIRQWLRFTNYKL